jgi:HlyD family secretion protein/epimerase transport system membrane fusion protein
MNNILPFLLAPSARPAEPPYPTSCARTIAFGWIVVGLLFGGFGTWASLAPLSSAAIAPGTVVVDSNRKSVQHLEGGVIREILVRDGDIVGRNQVLLRLDGAAVRAALASLQPMLTTNDARKARLRAERDGLDKIPFSADLLAEAKFSEATAKILAGQERIFETRRNALQGKKALNSNRLAQSGQRLEGLEQQLRVKEGEMTILGEQLKAQRTLLTKGYTTQQQVAGTKRMVQQLASEYADLQSKAEETRLLVERYKLEEGQIRKDFMEQVDHGHRPEER